MTDLERGQIGVCPGQVGDRPGGAKAIAPLESKRIDQIIFNGISD